MDNNRLKEEEAYYFAQAAHKGQTRWDKKTPYITHPVRVANNVPHGTCKIVAYLHDVVEDTYITLEEIEENFGFDVKVAVEAITKRKGEEYIDYLERVKANDIARKVKIADINDNLRDLNKGSLRDKYILAKRFLES